MFTEDTGTVHNFSTNQKANILHTEVNLMRIVAMINNNFRD